MKSRSIQLVRLMLFLALVIPVQLFAQTTGSIKGKIIDQLTKQPLIGATVALKDKSMGSATDTAGVFVIKNVPEGEYSITISIIGYQTKIVDNIEVVRNKTYYEEFGLLEEGGKLNEVSVTVFRGENNPLTPVSAYSFSREEIFRNPGAQGDVFRAIGILPGVTSSGAQYSAIAVRGQGTGDNVYMVDDMPMFDLSHFEIEGFNSGFNDPNGGRFSIFAPRVIDNADFQGGGFGAEYGRKASSLLNLGIKEGNKETPSFSGQFDLLGFTLIYDGPSSIDKKTSIFATARYQNFKLLEGVIGLTNAGLPVYGDYMIKTTTELNKKNKLSFIAMFNSETYTRTVDDVRDSKNLNDDNSSNFTGKSELNKAIFGLNLRTLTGKNSYWRNVLYYRVSNLDNNLGVSNPQVSSTGELINKDYIPYEYDLRHIKDNQSELGYRSIFTKHFDKVTIAAGVDLARVNLDYERTLKHTDTLYTFGPNDYRPDPSQYYLVLQPSQFNAKYNDFAINASGYVDLSFRLFKRLTLNPGVRYDHTGFNKEDLVSQRISGSVALNNDQSINFAAGIYYQDPSYINIASQPRGHTLTSEQTTQYIAGYKKQFSSDLKFVVEGWYKQLDNLIVQPKTGESYLTNDGTGFAYGGDINLTKRLSKNYYGQIGYSYMVSKRDDHDGQGEYDYIFSQPHVVSLLGSYNPNKKWIFSGKFRYSTGRPTDKYIVHSNVFNDASYMRYSQQIIEKNGDRLNDFVSLDLRADYKVQRNKTAITAFVDIVDIFNQFNQNEAIFQPLTGNVYYLGLAIFPTFGVRLEF